MRRVLRGGQDGFSLFITMTVLALCASLTAVAFTTVVGDVPLRKQGRDRKAAYAAAEAGLHFYMSRLNQDNEYWARCTEVAAPNSFEQNPVNQRWDGSGTDPRRWRVVPGETAKYTVELLPTPGNTQCLRTNPNATMLDPTTGTMRIRATGVAGKQKRSVIGTLRRKSFLDYLYFTDFETTDPSLYALSSQYAAYITYYCRRYRASRPQTSGDQQGCREIQFSGNDNINGPFHTNDDVLTCGATTFGRSAADRLEASGAAPGWRNPCGSTAPDFKSAWQAGVPTLDIPTSNTKITSVAVAPYILTGTHRIVINDTTMTITPSGKASYTLNLPANGVIWVKNGSGCGAGVSPSLQNYTEPAGCANVRVSGRYAKGLTLVSDKDIIVDGNLTRASDDNLMGLIATNFIRIFHPIKNRQTNDDGENTSCQNVTASELSSSDTRQPGTLQNVRIEAAILSLEHSFTVDNYNCGAALGTLANLGAIAQRFRGPVGTGNGSTATTGYTKDYNYDDRLKYRNPPYFLDPVAAAWRLIRMNEQVPAR